MKVSSCDLAGPVTARGWQAPPAVSADEIAMALHFSVLASLCAAASGLVVGRPLAPSLLPHAPRCSQCRMSLPIDESSTIAQLCGCET